MSERKTHCVSGVRSEALAWQLLDRALDEQELGKHRQHVKKWCAIRVPLASDKNGIGANSPTLGKMKQALNKLDPVFKGMHVESALLDGHLMRYLMRTMPVGKSRFGGFPDLPQGISWPEIDGKKMLFILQLNLEDIPDFAENLLPKSGRLYFFHGDNGDAMPPPKIIFVETSDTPLVRHPEPGPDDMCNFDKQPLERARIYDPIELDLNWLQATPGSRVTQGLNVNEVDDVFFAVAEMNESLANSKEYQNMGEVVGYLLGPDTGQNGVQWLAKNEGLQGKDWIPLAVFSSTSQTQWGDEPWTIGIRKSDLLARRFSKVVGFSD